MDHDDTRPDPGEPLDDFNAQLERLRAKRPAAYRLALAVIEVATADPNGFAGWAAEHTPPGPERPDEDLDAWTAVALAEAERRRAA